MQVGRNALFQHVTFHRLQHASILGALQPRGVHGDQHIRRGVCPLRLHPRDQLVGLALDAVDGDAGGIGKVGIKPLVRVIVARGIEVYLTLRAGAKGACHYGDGSNDKGGECGAGHGESLHL